MKHKFGLIACLIASTVLVNSSYADPNDPASQQMASDTDSLVKYLKNLGAYMGYNLENAPDSQKPAATEQLVNPNQTQTIELSAFNTLFGAIPVNAISAVLMNFVPDDGNSPIANVINSFANTTFKTPNPYSTVDSQQYVSALSSVDQKTYQPDPVNQAVLDILGTPDSSYCMTDPTTSNPGCLYGNKVMSNAIGTLPGTYEFFTYKYIQPFLSQLNSNTLISPLLYSTTSNSSDSTSSNAGQPIQNGLPAQTQAQQASNFIRYASGNINPIPLPKLKDYDNLYTQAANTAKNVPEVTQMQAQAKLVSYFSNLRAYAAQTSVGISNLYYILSKRMPQKPAGSQQMSSQALSEFSMATWRLFSPTDPKGQNVQWLNQINTASSAAVQKEIVTLLAEINYQLYLNRQQDERLLLTQTMLLMQNSRAMQPSTPSVGTDDPNS